METPESSPEWKMPAEGRIAVHTASSTHLIDYAERTITRVPATSEGSNEWGIATLRRDHESVPLLGMLEPQVGERLHALVDVRGDGISTVRQTTPIREIQTLS